MCQSYLNTYKADRFRILIEKLLENFAIGILHSLQKLCNILELWMFESQVKEQVASIVLSPVNSFIRLCKKNRMIHRSENHSL
jgi:hypothetical protein